MGPSPTGSLGLEFWRFGTFLSHLWKACHYISHRRWKHTLLAPFWAAGISIGGRGKAGVRLEEFRPT